MRLFISEELVLFTGSVSSSAQLILILIKSAGVLPHKEAQHHRKRVNLAIWDTAGQERFHALGPIYYRDSNGAILVYDITDEDSFQKVKNW
ncbi:hypothetical protein INR49_008227 [Caranx melampygus]|nr:hypothetical protein INR49_008227 [Caranx melampygus]